MAIKVKPADGYMAVRFIDDLSSVKDDSDEALLAIVDAVGSKVSGVKAGDTVILRPYARHGLKLGDDLVLIESYSVAGRVTG